ncbi:unnamed protein product [Ceutorhynchus assimilis]|uniref:Platelet-derived growth factor (PDGF) family profile domain-containing protein n=1 Tax=Ceutorhynchus assimilis TaxID=467358 RepID=A0A9P0GM66_9CUCU|nr:unnamed protein product [Ceutorhynchus assimilis]
MRLKHPLCFYFFVQLTFAYHQKNDYFKNPQRTNTKKYYPASWSAPDDVKLRHSTSKFPHFDQIKGRIDNLYSNSERSDRNNLFSAAKSDSTKYFNSDNRWGTAPKLRHHGYSNRGRTSTTTTTPSPDEVLFENYGDLDEEDDEKTEDDYPDIFINSSDYDEMKDSVQAEEPTATTTKEPSYASLTDYKWNMLGTMERVDQYRNKYYKQQENRKSPEERSRDAAVQHYFRVKSSGECKNPSPKVIAVHSEHPNPSVTYIPHCTVLHRCAEDTGCCKYDTACQYKEREEVSLYFYVKEIGGDTSKVEKLTFYNHTECECREKSGEPPSATERQKRVAPKNLQPSITDKVPENLLMKCKCPKEFLPKIKSGTKCHCDCDQNNEDCMRMKKGKEYSSLADRLCIQKRECGIVTCQYGPYDKQKGRCPKFEES